MSSFALSLPVPSPEEFRAERIRRSTNERAGGIEASKARCRTLVGFVKEAWLVLFPEVPYVHGWHIDFIAAHLEAVTFDTFLRQGLDNRLLINVPPGTMKSLLVAVFWLAWEWGPCGKAGLQEIVTSFREDFLVRDSNRFRRLINSEWFQERWPLTIVKDNEGKIENSRGGFRESVPFGSLTGGRADRLVIDDPHSVDTAESEADRIRAEMRFRESASERMNDAQRSAIVVIMQRLHESDVSGVILRLKLRYVHVMLPMEFEPDRVCVTPLGKDRRKNAGDLLFPERFPRAAVERQKMTLTPTAVAGQYQQRPAPRGGLMFKRHWFEVVPVAPADCEWVRGWDIAGTKKKTSAWTVGCKVGFHRASSKFYIAHIARDRTENPTTMVRNVATGDGFQCQISIPLDPGAAGVILARQMVAACVGYNIRSTPESGEKEDRALAVQRQAEAGNVCVVQGEWNETFFSELTTFPNSQFKDQVDALSRAFGVFIINPGAPVVIPIFASVPIPIFGENVNG